MPQPPKRRSPRKTTARAKSGQRPGARRSDSGVHTGASQRTRGTELDISMLLARNPTALALGGILIGAVTRRRWIFLSSLAAWLFLHERERTAGG
jgi:hypothetical protein